MIDRAKLQHLATQPNICTVDCWQIPKTSTPQNQTPGPNPKGGEYLILDLENYKCLPTESPGFAITVIAKPTQWVRCVWWTGMGAWH